MSKIFDMAQCNSIMGDSEKIKIPYANGLSPMSELVDAFILCEFGLNVPECGDTHSHLGIQFSGNAGVKYNDGGTIKIVVTHMPTGGSGDEEIIYTSFHEVKAANDLAKQNDRLISFNSSIDNIEKNIQSGYYRYRLYISQYSDKDIIITGPVYFQATSYLVPKITNIDDSIIKISKNDTAYDNIAIFSSGLAHISPEYTDQNNCILKSAIIGFGDSAPVYINKNVNSYYLDLLTPDHHLNNFIFGSGKNVTIKKIVSSVTMVQNQYIGIPIDIYIGIFTNNINSNNRQFNLYKKYKIVNLNGEIEEDDTYNVTIDTNDIIQHNEDHIIALFSEYINPNAIDIVDWIDLHSHVSIIY